MAIKLTTTKQANKFIKLLVYGKSGVGKTRMCRTAPSPIIISSENKLASLSDEDIPVIQVENMDDFEEVIDSIKEGKKKFKDIQTICIDSISDIVEIAISQEKKKHNDPRKAYMVIQDRALAVLRGIRDSEGKHWYIIAKAKMVQNEDGMDMYGPKMPGQQMGPELPYLFDFVFPLRTTLDKEEGKEGYSYLQTNVLDDIKWDAKSASPNLAPREEPNLTKLFSKMVTKKK